MDIPIFLDCCPTLWKAGHKLSTCGSWDSANTPAGMKVAKLRSTETHKYKDVWNFSCRTGASVDSKGLKLKGSPRFF